MDYLRNYQTYILYVLKLNRIRLSKSDPNYIYYEKHHIIPRCIGGSDNELNLVLLTAREHFLAHYLLCKIYGNTIHSYKLLCSLHCFTMRKSIRYFNSRLLEFTRSKLGNSVPEDIKLKMSKGHTGKYHTEYTKKLLSDQRIGIPKSKESKLKMRLAKLGKINTEESNRKRSEWSKNMPEELRNKISLDHHKRKWYYNPITLEEKYIIPEDNPLLIDNGWIPGRNKRNTIKGRFKCLDNSTGLITYKLKEEIDGELFTECYK